MQKFLITAAILLSLTACGPRVLMREGDTVNVDPPTILDVQLKTDEERCQDMGGIYIPGYRVCSDVDY